MGENLSSEELLNANREIVHLNKEKDSYATELIDAYKEIALQIEEKGNRAAELAIANMELVFQNNEKENRASELAIANEELIFQNSEKEKRAAELAIANIELVFQNNEKEKRASELAIANAELVYQKKEKDRRAAELSLLNLELERSEARVRKLNTELAMMLQRRTAQYSFISQVNQTIVHEKDVQALFRKSCAIALEFGQYAMAWIGEFDSDFNKIKISESSGMSLEVREIFSDLPFKIDGPHDIVLRTGTYFLCNDIENAPEVESWKPYAIKYGIRSGIVLPIKKSGKIFGTFNLYATELDFFTKEDIDLLVEVAGDISFALDMFEQAQKHSAAEELIIKNENKFRALIERSTDMKTLASADGTPFYASPAVSAQLGYSSEEFLNKVAADFLHPDDISRVFENLNRMLETPGDSFYSQHRMKRRDGRYIWCEGTISNLLHVPHVNAIVSNFRDISEKKSIEQQQEFHNNNLTALINNTTDLMWSVDRDFKLITYNQSFYEIMKKLSSNTATPAIGKSVLDLGTTREHSDRYKRYYERAFSGESFSELEYIDSPIEYWTQISFNPIMKGDEIVGTACHSHDITDIKSVEKQVKESEAFALGILNSLNSHIAVINEVGEIVAVNESWKQFSLQNSGHDLHRTCIGSNYFAVCEKAANDGAEFSQEAFRGIMDVMKKEKPFFYLEYPCNSPDMQRWFGMRVLKFESNLPLVVVTHTEITERKLAEENRLKSEARLKEAQAIAHVGSWEVDLVNNIHTWSDEFYNIYGISRDEVRASAGVFLSFFHPADSVSEQKRILEEFKTLKPSSTNFRFVTQDGVEKYGYGEWTFEFDKNNKPIRLYGVLQDVTARKIAEIEREKLIHDMIQRNRDLEQFTFIISHNLRAPIANIIGFADFLLDPTITPDEQNQLLKGLGTTVSQLDTTIKDINKILQVKKEVNERKELVSFSTLSNEIFVTIGDAIYNNEVDIKTDFMAVDEIYTVKVYMHSIFYNLITNSIKYRKLNGPCLIEIKSKVENNKTILTIKDNGLGIDLKTQGNKIFGLYNRFHFHVEGKGMGLFMVKAHAEALGGKITVTSERNVGTEFTIVFDK